MTTIAADLTMMVSDSRVSLTEKGVSYPAVKIVKAGGQIFGAAGDGGDCTRWLKWASSGFKGTEPKWATTPGTEDAVMGLVLNDKGIYVWSWGDPEPEKVESVFWAIGSGGKPARVAMMLGKTPIEAVEIAIEVDDIHSGKPLQIIKL